ncbi:hypothetical protein [Edaphobacter aggregans]|uniref:hypothetical protein n=1 Tax=Edaphobacter aggregans TaxID=570835 RepID=UPI0012FB1046|nr:hypothetical protein [Edaphobacter aggregans]
MKLGKSSWECLLAGVFVCVILLATAAAEGQSPDSQESRNRSAAELGKQVANPLSDVWLNAI